MESLGLALLWPSPDHDGHLAVTFALDESLVAVSQLLAIISCLCNIMYIGDISNVSTFIVTITAIDDQWAFCAMIAPLANHSSHVFLSFSLGLPDP